MVTPETKSTNGGRWGRVGVDATDSRRHDVCNDFPLAQIGLREDAGYVNPSGSLFSSLLRTG